MLQATDKMTTPPTSRPVVLARDIFGGGSLQAFGRAVSYVIRHSRTSLQNCGERPGGAPVANADFTAMH
jgi:hypothetical protein